MRILDETIYDGSGRCIYAVGTSSESKPTDHVISGSIYFEVDTSKAFMYNETSHTWVEAKGTVDEAAIEAAVAEWLEAHPEATTTVADGSITEPKLASALLTKINNSASGVSQLSDEIVDLKSATNTIDDSLFGNGFGHLPYDLFAVGRWSSDGASWNTDVTNRIASKGRITAQLDTRFNIDDGFRAYFWIWNGSSYTSSDWVQNGYAIPAGTQYKVMIARVTEVTETAYVNDFVNKLKIPFTFDISNNGASEVLLVSLKNVTRAQADNATRVSTYGNLVIPTNPGEKLSLKLPDGISCEFGFHRNNSPSNPASETGYKKDGQKVTIPSYAVTYRLTFKKGNGSENLPKSEIQGYIDDGSLKITYDKDVSVDDVCQVETYVKSALLSRHIISSGSELNDTHIPTFVYITDIHGDAQRTNRAYQVAKMINADAVLNGGDTTYSSFTTSRVSFLEDIDDMYNIPSVVAIGNHDANGVTSDTDLYNDFVKHYDDKYSFGNSGYPYFYYDVPNRNIRIIVLNNYEGHGNTPNWGQAQISWLISTLASTPQNYGVVVMYHKPCVAYGSLTSIDDGFVPDRPYSAWDSDSTEIIPKIIDAFISKTTISESFTQNGTTVTVSGDFSAVASGVEFIAHLFGHTHVDMVGYVNGQTNRQLAICSTCAIANYGSYQQYSHACEGDIPRGFRGSTQDAVNIITVDREYKKVKIARFGSNCTTDGKDRRMMVASYVNET